MLFDENNSGPDYLEKVEKEGCNLKCGPSPHLIYMSVLNSLHNYPAEKLEFSLFKTTNVSEGESSVQAPSHLSSPLLEITEQVRKENLEPNV